MTKEQFILLLKNYKENRTKLKLKLREKENILRKKEMLKDTILTVTNYEDNSDIHSKNIVSDKVGKQAINNADLEKALQKELEKVEEEIRELSSKVEEVEIRLEVLKKKEKEILVDYYIEGNSYEHIGNITYHNLFGQTRSADCIKKIIQKALVKIAEL